MKLTLTGAAARIAAETYGSLELPEEAEVPTLSPTELAVWWAETATPVEGDIYPRRAIVEGEWIGAVAGGARFCPATSTFVFSRPSVFQALAIASALAREGFAREAGWFARLAVETDRRRVRSQTTRAWEITFGLLSLSKGGCPVLECLLSEGILA